MSTWAIIATGQSLTQKDVDYVKGKCKIAAVSNAYQLLDCADLLVSYDSAWWRHHKEAINFDAKRLCRHDLPGVKRYCPPGMPMGCNSGLMAMFAARDEGAKRLLLLGFDMHGTHYFGAHPPELKTTSKKRFKDHIGQFIHFSGCEVINCTPGSALTRYPMIPVQNAI